LVLAGFGQYRQFHAAFYLNIAPRNLIALHRRSKISRARTAENLDWRIRQMKCVIGAKIVRCYATECSILEHQ
jgi:hypothetical protein